ncbi:MAG: LysM peptidoglycan-binding domain-containing protein [Aquificaceae bacterium]|nr:LysM peptidoglycan-binding domain-containing protein [Aquificaceae bacterium]
MLRVGLALLISACAFASVECKRYVVRKGDTAYSIAKKNKMSLEQLSKANPGKNVKSLKTGDSICIPVSKAPRKAQSYDTYTIKKGAKLEHVAQKLGIPKQELERLNPELKDRWLSSGESVKIPSKKRESAGTPKGKQGATYVVKKGARLEHIAQKLGIPRRELERLNPELKGKWLPPGQVVRIPRSEKAEVAKLQPEKERVRHVIEERREVPRQVEQKPVIPREPREFSDPTAGLREMGLEMPVDGKMSKVPRGIEIVAPCSSPIKVVDGGKVIYSGGDLQAYGNMVIVEHGNFISLYAYNEENLVKRGERVNKGQVIARVGRRHNAEECALRFEIRNREGVPLDPTEYIKGVN